MTKIKVKHLKSGEFLAQNVDMANSFKTRLMGLMFSNDFGDRDGIWFQPSNSIHTFFVKFSIDVIFINKNNHIVRLYRAMKPWRLTPIIFSASRVLELPANTLGDDICLGDELEVTHV